jgi:hypothetical protein
MPDGDEEGSGQQQDGEQDQQQAAAQQGTPKGKSGGGTSDIDKLKSVYDKRESELQGQLTTLNARLKEIEAERSQDVIISRVKAEFDQIDFENKDGALEKLTELINRVTNSLSRSESLRAADAEYAQTQAVNYYALKLVTEHGGEFETYRRELEKAKTLDALELAHGKLELQVMREAGDKPGNGSANGNGPGQRQSVDEGRGGAVTSSLLKEMDDIDVTTPEGQRLWEEKEASFEKRLRELNGARR